MRWALKCEFLTSFKRWSHAFSLKRVLVEAEVVDTHLPEGTIGTATHNPLAPIRGVNAAVKPSFASKTIKISVCSVTSIRWQFTSYLFFLWQNFTSTCCPASDKETHEKTIAGKIEEETAAAKLATSSLMNTSEDGTGLCTLGLPPHQCNRNLHLDPLDARTLHHNGKCFCCDGVLLNWSRNDNPWMARIRWNALVLYLDVLNGQDFVGKFRSHFEVISLLSPFYFDISLLISLCSRNAESDK